MRLMAALFVATLVTAGLSAQAPSSPASGSGMTLVAKGSMSGVETARQVTVRTQSEWQKLWKEHSPDEKMPSVDFSSRMVVGLFLGSKPSDGYDVEVLRVRPEGRDLVVEYAQTTPARGTMAAQILTEPFHLVAVPKHAGTVRFLHVPK